MSLSLSLEDDDQDKDNVLISLTSLDNQLIQFPVRYIKQINVLCVAIQHELHTQELSSEPLPIQVPVRDLQQMYTYFATLERYKQQPQKILKPCPFADIYKCTSECEADFVNECWKNQEEFFSLIRSCNFLDCEPLYNLLLCKLQCIVKSYPLDMLHKIIKVNSNKN